MVVRTRLVWLLCTALFVAGAATEAAASWTPMVKSEAAQSTFWIGPDGSTDSKGGADPDEPLGPERVASTEWVVLPESKAWSRLVVVTLLRLHWLGGLGR